MDIEYKILDILLILRKNTHYFEKEMLKLEAESVRIGKIRFMGKVSTYSSRGIKGTVCSVTLERINEIL